MKYVKLISVIVPIYKVEPYLPSCLDSILSSTYRELEIILIDDGSPDNCPAICDEYAFRDPRIKVIHQDNQGLVVARNVGLSIATGDYVAFVDSDDVISPIMYEAMVSAMERTGADMAACEYTNDVGKLSRQVCSITDNDRCLESFEEQLAMLTNAHSVRDFTWTGCYVWDKLYRRGNIKSEFQTQCIICEDLEFNWRYIHFCEKTVMIPQALYMYRINSSGITGVYRAQRRNAAMVDSGVANARQWAAIARYSEVHDETLRDYLNARAAYAAHGAICRIYATKQEKKYSAYCVEGRALLNQYCGLIQHDTETYSLLLRIMCGLCRRCFLIWKTIARIYGKF